MRYHLTLIRMAIIKKLTNNEYWRSCGERQQSYIDSGNINWYIHYEEQCRGSLKNKKWNYHVTQQSHSWTYIQRKP